MATVSPPPKINLSFNAFSASPRPNLSTAVSLISTASISVFESGFHFRPVRNCNSYAVDKSWINPNNAAIFRRRTLAIQTFVYRSPSCNPAPGMELELDTCFTDEIFSTSFIKVIMRSSCSFSSLPGSTVGPLTISICSMFNPLSCVRKNMI